MGPLKSSYEMLGEQYQYQYIFDNRQTQTIVVGDNEESFPNASLEGPHSWISSGAGWTAWADAERSAQAKYSILSDHLPGLIRMTFAGDDVPLDDVDLPADLTPFERQHVIATIRQHVHSTDRYVIGPAFGPEPTEAEVRERIQRWVMDYGFSFLEPLHRNPAALDQADWHLKPSNEFESQVLECLKLTLRSIVS